MGEREDENTTLFRVNQFEPIAMLVDPEVNMYTETQQVLGNPLIIIPQTTPYSIFGVTQICAESVAW